MANKFENQKKVISINVGAIADGAYLYAGADKSIKAEMVGKDNGDTIYYRSTNLGSIDEAVVSGSGATPYAATANAKDIKQAAVPVQMTDAKIMYDLKTFEKMCANTDEALQRAKVGQKIAKKAVGSVIAGDLKRMGNIFVGTDYKVFQLAGAYLKSIVDSELYGWMDWQVWGDLTSKGQQSVPCSLANPAFGKNLVGSWSLIDQLRTSNDLPVVTGADLTNVASWAGAISGDSLTITPTAAANATLPSSGVCVLKLGVKMCDTNDVSTIKDWEVMFDFAKTGDDNEIVFPMPAWAKAAGVATADLTVAVGQTVTSGKTYGLTIVRAENAQVFGTADTVNCEGAKYSKSSLEGITIHENQDCDVPNLKTYDRFDMVYACQLIEPRVAALVLYKLD